MRGTFGRAVIAALVGLVAALLVSASAGAAGCIVLCPTTTTSTPAPPARSAPTLTGLSARRNSATSYTFTATLNPGGEFTTYSGYVASTTGISLPTNENRDLPAGSGPTVVSITLTNFAPRTHYDVGISAVNSSGSAHQTLPITTTLLDPSPVTLTARTRTFEIGDSPGFVAEIQHPHATQSVSLVLQAAPLGSHDFRTIETQPGYASKVSFGEGARVNSTYRVVLTGRTTQSPGTRIQQPSTSNTVLARVFPRGSLTVARPSPESSTVVVTESFAVHAVKHSFVGEPVYFYRGASRAGPFTRFASVRLHASGFAASTVGARAQLDSPSAGAIVACVRHQVLPDMGVPFTEARCGAPTFGRD